MKEREQMKEEQKNNQKIERKMRRGHNSILMGQTINRIQFPQNFLGRLLKHKLHIFVDYFNRIDLDSIKENP